MKNIAIIAGGNSSEYEVSMKSGKNIYDEVDENRYNKSDRLCATPQRCSPGGWVRPNPR